MQGRVKSYGIVHAAATTPLYTHIVRVLVVLCHPNQRSFCHAISLIAEQAIGDSGGVVTKHDLYKERFDPVLSAPELSRQFSLEPTIQAHTRDVLASAHIVFVHPDWWGGPPAILKGWMDRVFRPGVAYEWAGEEFGEKHHQPLLTGRSVSVFVTTDREADDPPESIRLFWNDACRYAGLSPVTVTFFPRVRESTVHQRREWLSAVAENTARGLP